MSTLFLLSTILFVCMVLIGGQKGVKSFLSLFINFIVIFFSIFFMMSPQIDPIIIAAISSIIITCVNLFFINEVNIKTWTAFISTLITIGLLFALIYIVTKVTMIQGFGEEEIDELIPIFSLYVGIDFVKIATSVMLMSTLGSIIDVAISITSPMEEIFIHNPNINRKDLFKSGVTIGKDILGSNANTLFFAFIGGYLALLIWFKDLSYTFLEIINSKIFTAQIITIFIAGIGIAIIIPIASFINAYYLVHRNPTKKFY